MILRYFNKWPLGYKLVIISSVPIVSMALLIMTYLLASLEESIKTQTENTLLNLTEIAALSMSNPFVIYNKDILDNFVDTLAKEINVTEVMIIDTQDWHIMTHNDHQHDGQVFDQQEHFPESLNQIHNYSGNLFVISRPIHIDQQMFALLLVRFTLDKAYHEMSSIRIRILSLALGAITLGVILAILSAKFISSPIRTLTEKALRIAEGHYNQDFDYHRADEIGILAQSFETLQRSINQKITKLQQEINIRKMVEEELQRYHREKIGENQEKYKNLFYNSNDGVILHNIEGTVLDVNHRFLDLFEYSREELLHLPSDKLFTEAGNLISQMAHEILQKQGFFQFETFCRKKNGLEFPAAVSASTFSLDKKPVIQSIIRDLSQQKKIEMELEDAKMEADSANRAKTRFLANMSHEIRTPLNAIIGFTQVLMHQKSVLPLQFQDYLQNIHVSGNTLVELINNILDLSKIEAGRMTLNRESLDIKLMIQSMYHIYKVSAGQKSLKFIYDLDPALPQLIVGDRTKINQIMMNLLSNAIKFTPPGKTVYLRGIIRENQLLLEVEDEGVGIAPEEQQQVFESFTQAHNQPQEVTGTGLGLTITLQLVQLMKGTIQLDSTPGKGSRFTVSLPLEISTEGSNLVSMDPAYYHFSPDNLVLLVEDNPMNQAVVQAIFDTFHLQIHIAANGLLGVEKTFELKPDLVIMDLNMPVMDGLEAIRRIRKNPEHEKTAIVILSAHAFVEQQQEALQAGVSEYLTKPLEYHKLIPALVKYLRSDRSQPTVARQEALPSLPYEMEASLLNHFEELKQIHFFRQDKLFKKITQIQQLIESYQSIYSGSLAQLHQATHERNETLFGQILDNIILNLQTKN
ncbi:MAG: response regulator [SAR324 cluster bacterium]|nr:response regulator [SAR324 cluster bacterium]